MQENTNNKIKELEEQIASLQEENATLKIQTADLENNWKRALADYRNFQKRVDEEKQSFVDFATSSLILRFLITLDNLELLSQHVDDSGLKMIIKEMQAVFADEGLKEVDALGKDFDSLVMDAVDTSDGDKNKVTAVSQKGYFLKSKLIRPAKVKVGSGQKEEK